MSDLYALLRAGKFYNAQHEKSDLHIQAASRIEALEAENRRLRELLERWCQTPEITEIHAEDLEPETDKVWRETRAALEGEKP